MTISRLFGNGVDWVRPYLSRLYDLQHNLLPSQDVIVYLKPSLRVAGYITAVPLFDNLPLPMTAPMSEAENTRAVLRSQEPELQYELPWNREGEFEIEALILSQSKSDLLVKVKTDRGENHLTISGFLPGRVAGQRWRLECLRSSGSIELLDGEPLE